VQCGHVAGRRGPRDVERRMQSMAIVQGEAAYAPAS
jgi:hypothetical protein